MNKIQKLINAQRAYSKDKNEYERLFKENNLDDFIFDKKYSNKQLFDRFDNAGSLEQHYFLQDIYIAKKIIKNNISNHYDIGSRVDGFISHLLSSDINVHMIDIRPLPFEIDNLNFIEGNATDLSNIKDNSLNSLSSLHAVEHFGLGRYGDPVDPLAWKKALSEYKRVLAKNGTLYLSVPIGPENKLCFNAHRIFNPTTISNELYDLELVSFSYIKNMHIYENVNINDYSESEDYLCGLFEFEKKII